VEVGEVEVISFSPERADESLPVAKARPMVREI